MIKIDFEELRTQKEWLLDQTIGKQQEEQPEVWGLIHLIDALQDHAVEVENYSEYDVFGKSLNEDVDEDIDGLIDWRDTQKD